MVYAKIKVFIKSYTEGENKNYLYLDKNNQPDLTLTTPLIERRKYIDCLMLYSFKGPFELLHGVIVDIRFLAKSSVVVPKYCLFLVDLFTFKIYTYPIKKYVF